MYKGSDYGRTILLRGEPDVAFIGSPNLPVLYFYFNKFWYETDEKLRNESQSGLKG